MPRMTTNLYNAAAPAPESARAGRPALAPPNPLLVGREPPRLAAVRARGSMAMPELAMDKSSCRPSPGAARSPDASGEVRGPWRRCGFGGDACGDPPSAAWSMDPSPSLDAPCFILVTRAPFGGCEPSFTDQEGGVSALCTATGSAQCQASELPVEVTSAHVRYRTTGRKIRRSGGTPRTLRL